MWKRSFTKRDVCHINCDLCTYFSKKNIKKFLVVHKWIYMFYLKVFEELMRTPLGWYAYKTNLCSNPFESFFTRPLNKKEILDKSREVSKWMFFLHKNLSKLFYKSLVGKLKFYKYHMWIGKDLYIGWVLKISDNVMWKLGTIFLVLMWNFVYLVDMNISQIHIQTHPCRRFNICKTFISYLQIIFLYLNGTDNHKKPKIP